MSGRGSAKSGSEVTPVEITSEVESGMVAASLIPPMGLATKPENRWRFG